VTPSWLESGQTQVLDNGYIKLVTSWGSDEGIIEAARMSTGKGFKGWGPKHQIDCIAIQRKVETGYQPDCRCNTSGDEKLLRFLWEHKHHTPFEMAGLTFEVQAPIFVLREWMRHRTQSFNEMSGRYIALPDLYYIPSVERLMAGKQATNNKQASMDGFTAPEAHQHMTTIIEATTATRKVYEGLLDEGLSRELARLVVPVNQYSRMRASANLRNWLAFLALRLDEGAQWEIREYARQIGTMIEGLFPRTYELFKESL
jgi:thymidylate synthase (FAD)